MFSYEICTLLKTIVSDFNIKSLPEHYQLYVPESAQVGSAVGKIKANDADTGSNADMTYSITNGDGIGIFSISTDKDTREGILSLKKVSKQRILLIQITHQYFKLSTFGRNMNNPVF